MPFCYPFSMIKNLLTPVSALAVLAFPTVTAAQITPDSSIVVSSSDCLESIIRFQSTRLTKLNKSTYKLDFGPILLQAGQDAVIETPGCSVNLKDKAIALIAVSPTCTRVFNLHEAWKDNLIVEVRENNPFEPKVSVGPGQDLAIIKVASRNELFARKIYLDDKIHRRKIKHQYLKDQVRLYSSRYMLLDLFKHNRLLKAANHCKKKHTRHLIGKVLRTAVTLKEEDFPDL